MSSDITIDGTDALGNPAIVGDAFAAAQGNQSTFNHAIDLKNTTKFLTTADNTIVRGLAISNTTSGGQPGSDLIESTGTNTSIQNVRIDGGATGTCGPGCMFPSTALMSLGGSNAQVDNVEALAAYATGAYLASGGSTVRNSWFHNNYASDVSGADALLQRNLLELTGRRRTDNTVQNASGVGVQTIGTGQIQTEGNLIRNAASYGISAYLIGGLDLNDDAVCGNGADGVSVDGFNRVV